MSLIVSLLAAVASAAQPLQPSGKWIVDYADSACILQRDFGTGADEVTIGLSPALVGPLVEVIVVHRNDGAKVERCGEATLQLSSRSEPIRARFGSDRFSKSGLRLSSFHVDEAELAALGSTKSIAIEMGKLIAVTVVPTHMPAALKALAACRQDLIRTIGLDPAEVARIVTPAKAVDDATYWITDADYPLMAVRLGWEGITQMVWTIDETGAVSDCRILSSAGHALLDKAGCAAVRKRARYTPALDASGKPIRSWHSRRVRWRTQ